MNNNLIRKLFSSGLQAIAVQVFGGIFFIIISLYLPKTDSGDIAWANSVALVLVMALSFGMDQVVVRRIAASDRSDWAAPAYFFHLAVLNTATFIIIYLIVLLGGNGMMSGFRVLPWMFLVQGLLSTAGPLKFYFNAKQQFRPYAIIAIISNTAKLGIGIGLLIFQHLSLITSITTLVACAAFELLALLTYIIATAQFSFYFKWIAYKKLLKEAFPQYISVLFDSSLARADIILLGIISTSIITSEYNLAYRAYEIAKLPLTIIGPILLARFARILASGSKADENTQTQVMQLYRFESFFSMLIPLLLNLMWAPLLDDIFNKKFGSVNAPEFMILSICIPIHFLINLLWTLCFSAKKYKQISAIIGITAIINIILNIVFINLWDSNGAAIAFLITTVLQLFGYLKLAGKHIIKIPVMPFIIFTAIAILAYIISIYLTEVLWLRLIIATVVYIIMSIVSKQVNKEDMAGLQAILLKKKSNAALHDTE